MIHSAVQDLQCVMVSKEALALSTSLKRAKENRGTKLEKEREAHSPVHLLSPAHH